MNTWFTRLLSGAALLGLAWSVPAQTVIMSDDFENSDIDTPINGRAVNNAQGGTLSKLWAAQDGAVVAANPNGGSKCLKTTTNWSILAGLPLTAGKTYRLDFTMRPVPEAGESEGDGRWRAWTVESDSSADMINNLWAGRDVATEGNRFQGPSLSACYPGGWYQFQYVGLGREINNDDTHPTEGPNRGVLSPAASDLDEIGRASCRVRVC